MGQRFSVLERPQNMDDLQTMLNRLDSTDPIPLSPEDESYLPLTPEELHHSSDASADFRRKLLNITMGIVSHDTTTNWGVNTKDGQTLAGEDDPTLNILTIEEPHPSGQGHYVLHYVFANNFDNKWNTYMQTHKSALMDAPCFRSIYNSLKLAYDATDQKHNDINDVTDDAIIEVFQFFSQSFSYGGQHEWVGALLFSLVPVPHMDQRTPNVVHTKDDTTNLQHRRPCATHHQSIMALCSGKLMSIHVSLNSSLAPLTIKIPFVSNVGNIEQVSSTSTHRPMRDTSQHLAKLRDAFKTYPSQQLILLKVGSCSLLMSLVMKQFRQMYKFPLLSLNNAGGIAACKCYTTAAAVNHMVTLFATHNDEFNTEELLIKAILQGVNQNPNLIGPTISQSSGMHCDPIHNNMKCLLFVDAPTAVRMFKFGEWYVSEFGYNVAEDDDDDDESTNHNIGKLLKVKPGKHQLDDDAGNDDQPTAKRHHPKTD